jgi:hypothetical protein
MKRGHLFPAILGGMLLSLSCGSSSEPERITGAGIPEYGLGVVDSFGVETGDSLHMIGSINGLCFSPDGSILVFDRAAMRIRVIPGQGEPFLVGREGAGPGEFLRPQSMCALPGGTILVSDEMKQAVMAFSPSGTYLGDYFTTDRYVPYRMFPVDSASIVGTMLDLEMGDQIIFTFYTGRFDADSAPAVRYSALQWEWPCPEIYTEIEMSDVAADPGGRVFTVRDNSAYLVSVFSPAGEEMFVIENPDVARLPKTPEELEEETEHFESRARNDQAYTGGYEPCPFHRLISLAGVDAEGNLWIERHDREDGHHFDVWDSSGNPAHTARLAGYDDVDMWFSVSSYGMLAAVVDEDHFPRVYTLELLDGESQ